MPPPPLLPQLFKGAEEALQPSSLEPRQKSHPHVVDHVSYLGARLLRCLAGSRVPPAAERCATSPPPRVPCSPLQLEAARQLFLRLVPENRPPPLGRGHALPRAAGGREEVRKENEAAGGGGDVFHPGSYQESGSAGGWGGAMGAGDVFNEVNKRPLSFFPPWCCGWGLILGLINPLYWWWDTPIKQHQQPCL